MSSLSLKTKLTGLLLAGLVALFVTGGGAAIGVEQLRQLGKGIYEKAFVDMGLLADLQLSFERQQSLVSRAPAELDLERLAEQRAAFDDLSVAMRMRIEQYNEQSSDAALAASLTGLEEKLSAYEAQAADVFASAENFDSENAIALVAGPLAEVASLVAGDLTALSSTTSAGALTKVETMQSSSRLIVIAVVAVSAVLTVLLGGGGYLFVSRAVSRPIADLSGVMKQLADGNNDVDIPSTGRKDEIGTMAQTVRVFQENAIEKERLQDLERAKELEAKAERERLAKMAELSDRFAASVATLIDEMGVKVGELSDNGRIVSDASERTRADAAEVVDTSEQTSRNVQTVAVAVEQLSASIHEINTQATSAMEMTSSAAKDTRQAMDEASTLSQAADEVGSIIELINAIAEQTNLLALNATIEAARAGDAGKGFAVVASEVKSLANQTGQATEEISAKIKGIQTVAENMSRIIGQVDGGMGRMDEIASGIASAVEEQGAATQEISRNIGEAADGTKEVSQSMGQVDQCARDTNDAVSSMMDITNRLADQAAVLKTETDTFLSGIRQGAA